jgi:spore maturation protein CgeB
VKFVLFYHSFASCWNHGNAHFLRGVARELIRVGHDVTLYEPADGWSRTNALREGGGPVLAAAAKLVPGVEIRLYREATLQLDRALEGADVVIAHEWNDPWVVSALGSHRLAGGRFLLLFHDTHHRAVTAPHELERFDLDGYDGVLAFGDVLREIYRKRGWGLRVFTWHEAADTAVFRLHSDVAKDTDLVWIGNWGDGERTEELQRFLIEPVTKLGIKARVHGVRYPEEARDRLVRQGIEFAGWLPNHKAPAAFARARVTVHIPRRPYVEALPGIPTIRMFEALACGIPLISGPWRDTEGLFPPGSFLMVDDGAAMSAALSRVLRDADLAEELARAGLRAIWTRHTCAHRVKELLGIVERLAPRWPQRPIDEPSQEAMVAG